MDLVPMALPTAIRINVDRQGRMVLPKQFREELGADPGVVILRRTADGVLLSPLTPDGTVEQAADGLPVLHLGRPVANDEVLQGIDEDRANR